MTTRKIVADKEKKKKSEQDKKEKFQLKVNPFFK